MFFLYICRVSSQSIDKQKEILAAALKLFAAYGFHGTPTSKIAKEAGVANGTLFHYYKTKEDLIVSLYLDIKIRMSAHVEDHAKIGKNVKDNFKSQYVQVLLWSLQNKDEFQFLQQFTASPYAALISPEMMQEQLKKTCAQIEDAIMQKAIKKRQPEFILSLFTSHTFGLNHYLIKTDLKAEEQEQTIKESFEMLWAMLS